VVHRRTLAGERAVKSAGTRCLPASLPAGLSAAACACSLDGAFAGQRPPVHYWKGERTGRDRAFLPAACYFKHGPHAGLSGWSPPITQQHC
jgi:hypothetical protein